MNQPVNILIVEDSEEYAELALRALRRGGFDTTSRRVQTAADLEIALAGERWDAIISDYDMPGFTGMDALRIIRSTGLDLPFILISGSIGEEIAVAAMKAGASDYIMKASLARLAPALERELKQAQARAASRQAQRDLIKSESHYRTLIEQAVTGIFATDRANNFVLVNSRYCQMLGYEERELLSLNVIDTYPEDQRAGLEEQLDTLDQLGARTFERNMRRKDGTLFPVEVSVVQNDEGRRQGIVRDITERKRSEQVLRESQQRLDGIVTSAMDAIVSVDEEERIVLSNPAAETMFGYSAAELQGQPLAILLPESLGPKHSAHIAAFGETGVTNRKMGHLPPIRGLRKSGEEFPIEASISKHESGGRRFFTAILRDITERSKSDQRIHRLNRVYAVLSGINSLIVRVRDRDELFREACRIAVEDANFGMAWIGLLDATTLDITPVAWAGSGADVYAGAKPTARSDIAAGQGMVGRAIRERRPVFSNDILAQPGVGGRRRAEAVKRGFRSLITLPLLVNDDVIGNFSIFAPGLNFFTEDEVKLLTTLTDNISFALEVIQKEQKLNYLAYYDVLTGLANRSLFIERVAQHMRIAAGSGHKLAVFLIDIERFKNINDSLGRPAGDALLKQVAQWLTGNAGDANLLARLGADQFAAVMPEVNPAGNLGRLLDNTMEALVDHPFRLDDAVLRIAVKIGAALFPDDGADADTLIRNAEAALKKAKASGDRYLFYTLGMTAAVAGKLTLENQLRQALDKGEFVLHYQPKVSLASGKLTGAEALIRWNDPQTGLVPPGRFIPVLEETGLIYEVGRWALRQAIADTLRWRAAGLPALRIAVNVSPLQLRHRGFVAEIGQVISVDAHAAAGLELEITESLIMEDIRHSIASLQAIRAMGVNIAIDDFGTGFSSLSYLAKLPVDALKIDRSFVIDMMLGPEGLALVSTIINLAHSLKLKVVAEGVETGEQSRLLRLLSCDDMQGFLFSKPVPAEIFEAKFLTKNAASSVPFDNSPVRSDTPAK